MSSCSTLLVFLWITGISATQTNISELTASEINNACDPREPDQIKISIFSRKNKTGQLYAQVKLEEGSEEKSSWQVDIDHDSACGLPSGGWNRQQRGQALESSTNIQPPKPLYDLIPGFGYYKFHNRGKTWHEAKHVCEKEGAHLAIINSREEAEILVELFARLPTIHRIYNFVGITDIFQEGSWVTIFDKPLNDVGFTDWDSTQPEGGYSQNCGCLQSKNGKLHDITCSDISGFFCELEL